MSRIFETQNQMIIRFPEDIAEKLNAYFNNPDNVQEPNIEIQMDPTRQSYLSSRLGLNIHVDSQKYKATVMQLPTISSTFKTLDRINFFKSNDVSEMIVVHDKYDDEQNIRQDEAQKVVDSSTGKIIQLKMQSGLTPPTLFIKQNNFKVKPEVDFDKVQVVDKQMQKIRSETVQNKMQDDKSSTGGARKKKT